MDVNGSDGGATLHDAMDEPSQTTPDTSPSFQASQSCSCSLRLIFFIRSGEVVVTIL